VAVTVGGLQVKPGDLLHADANGIVNIPHQIAAAVAELCELYIQAEEIILQYLRGSQPTVAGYREAVLKAKQCMAELKKRARLLLESKP
jgi:4-hydroxy-4-methyl-2-oxoglutarate aldolase